MELSTNSPEFRAIIDEVVNYVEKRPSKKWIDQEEVDSLYSIKSTQLYELRKSGILKEKKIGTKVLVSVASIEKFLNS